MTRPFRTHLPYRHARTLRSTEDLPVLSLRFRSQVAVRPARLVFQGHPTPRTEEVPRWIHDHDPKRAKGGVDERRPPHFPFVYRGHVAAHPEGEGDVAVRLWEEPSGRPLDAALPRDWFADEALYRGMPFRLVTWMVEEASGELAARGRIERLGADVAEQETTR